MKIAIDTNERKTFSEYLLEKSEKRVQRTQEKAVRQAARHRALQLLCKGDWNTLARELDELLDKE